MSDSKKIDDGGPAFAHPGGANDATVQTSHLGMSLRQWYAGQALPGLIQGYAVAYGSPTSAIAEICTEAVNFADELILALKAGG